MKKQSFSSEIFECEKTSLLADQLKALAHPARLQILYALSNQEQCCCNDFCACLPLAQSTISQHLKILKNAGIINCSAAGNCSSYSLNIQVLQSLIGQINELGDLFKVQAQGINSQALEPEIQKVN